MENRAAVFTSQPQAVEVYERGGWLPASMLGWRHDSDGACSAWVQVEFAGVVEDAWVELTRLRLPESPQRHLMLARAPKATPAGVADAVADAVAVVGPVDPAETQQLPLVRDGGVPPVGRRARPSGGRRRAPETGELAVTPPGPQVAAPEESGAVPGRHRAPAEEGRHRAADTGMLAAVPAGATAGSPASSVPVPRDAGLPLVSIDAWSAPPVRSELPPAGPVVRGQHVRDLDAERFTRPLRLDDGVGSARRSRRDSLSV